MERENVVESSPYSRTVSEKLVMTVPIALAAVFLANTACVSTVPGPQEWLKGKYSAEQVATDRQRAMFALLKNQTFLKVTPSVARAATKAELPEAKYFYVAKASIVGGGIRPDALPGGISVSVDVNKQGIAHITSFRLSTEQGTSEMAVILASETPIKGVVAICGAAQ